jgi:tetratricopeptide (TPR) repeat protein
LTKIHIAKLLGTNCLHYSVKEYENAIRAFEYATLIDDELWVLYGKGKSLRALKKNDKAIENYNRTIELDDANPTRIANRKMLRKTW